MKQNTEKQEVGKRVPFNVPDGYFFDLKNNIQSHTENLSSREGFGGIFTSKAIVLTFVCTVIAVLSFNYILNPNSNIENDFINEANEEVILFEIENINEEIFLEFLPQDEYVFSDDIQYLIENNTDYNMIIE